MRLFQKYMAFFALIALLFTSCSKDETTTANGDVANNAASIYFGPVLADLGSQFNRQQEQDIPECSTDDPAYAQIILIYGESNTEVSVVVEILQDDQGLFTAYDDELEIPIPSGETTVSVTLTDFVVWNDVDGAPGTPIWVAPKEGSEYAQFVSDPLSNTFPLRAGSKNYVNVDVICFDDRDVNLYGYQFFDINPVPLYEFCVFANYCTDAGRHYTADYTFALYRYDENGENGKGEMIYSSLSPETGIDDGTYWADPLCVTIPGPGDLASNVPYLVFEATLLDWPGNYTAEEDDESIIIKTLSWDMIKMLFDKDGNDETTEYYHVFFNCDDEDGPVDCDLNDPQADCDNDGIPNGEDNCPEISNEDQADLDGDDIGDVCDEDRDGDGADNNSDPCPDDPNDDCVDECTGRGGDTDGDGICDDDDNCPNNANPDQADLDGDDIGDVCDEDRDGDGTDNGTDPCPDDPNDNCVDECAGRGGDTDGDGICDDVDNCSGVANPDQADFDQDGIGDVCDPDIDNDGVLNEEDDCDFEKPDVDEDRDGCEDDVVVDPDFTCDFSLDTGCFEFDFDQSEESPNEFGFYPIEVNSEVVGAITISIVEGDVVVLYDITGIGYLVDDIGIIIDDGTEKCFIDLGITDPSGGDEVIFEGSYGTQENVQIKMNICPST